MLSSLINKFGSILYIQIWENRIRAVDIKMSAVFDEKPLLQITTDKRALLLRLVIAHILILSIHFLSLDLY